MFLRHSGNTINSNIMKRQLSINSLRNIIPNQFLMDLEYCNVLNRISLQASLIMQRTLASPAEFLFLVNSNAEQLCCRNRQQYYHKINDYKIFLLGMNEANGLSMNERLIHDRSTLQTRTIHEQRAIQERALQERAIQEQRVLQERAIQERALQERALQERALQERVLQERVMQERGLHAPLVIQQGHVMQQHDGRLDQKVMGGTIASPGPV